MSLGTLATFNSPGISRIDADQFEDSSARDVAHFVTSGDLVQLSGDAYISGRVEYGLFDKITEANDIQGFSGSLVDYITDAHTGYWFQEELYTSIGTVGGADDLEIRPISNFQILSSSSSSTEFNDDSFSFLGSTTGDVPVTNFDFDYDTFLRTLDYKVDIASSFVSSLPVASTGATAPIAIAKFAFEAALETVELAYDIENPFESLALEELLETRGAVEETRDFIGPTLQTLIPPADVIFNFVSDRWEDLQNVPENVWSTLGINPREAGEGYITGAREAGERFGNWVQERFEDDAVYTNEGVNYHAGTTPAFMSTGDGEDTLISEGGGSVLQGGAGGDDLEINNGGNIVFGLADELNGDHISGFGESDLLFYSNAQFTEDQLRVEEGSAILNVDSDADGEVDSVVTLEGDYDIDAFKVTDMETGTGITYEPEKATVPCFTPQSLIMTKRGLVPAGDIREGDLLVTRDHGYQPVNWIGRQALSREELARRTHLAPILIRRGALGDGIPERDMMMSPQHKMLWISAACSVSFGDPEVFVAAKHLTYLPGIEPIVPDRVIYLHFLFDQHEVVLADGAWSESFNPGRNVITGMDKDQSTELLELFPDLRGKRKSPAFLSARRSLKRHEVMLLA